MPIIESNAFPDYDQLSAALQTLEKAAPELVRVETFGHSPEKRDLRVVTVADVSTGPPLEYRPALLVTGQMHAVEFGGCCQSLHLLNHLVEHAGDESIRSLLQTHVFHVIPRIAVDAVDFVLRTCHKVRSRYVDVREPNVPYPEDLNGDGRILKMRWPHPAGRYRLCEREPRILVPVSADDPPGPRYEMCPEGLIHDWDGGPIQAPTAARDFNRNFPVASWAPSANLSRGGYPLSEPETRALADFVIAHPHIVAAVDFHNGNPAIFRKRTSYEPGPDTPFLQHFWQLAADIVGFPLLDGYEQSFTGVKPKQPSHRPGSYGNWVLERMGIPAVTVEMGMHYNFLGFDTADLIMPPHEHEEKTSIALIEAHDRNPQAELFFDWQPFDHPQLGRVEIGGWNPVPWTNPPLTGDMQRVCERGTRLVLEYTRFKPALEIAHIAAEAIAPDVYRVRVDVVSRGSMPTSLTHQGAQTHPALRPQVALDADGQLECLIGRQVQTIEHLKAHHDRARLEWAVRAEAGTTLSVTVRSPRSGFDTQTLELPSEGEAQTGATASTRAPHRTSA